jgi:hypothetical protein
MRVVRTPEEISTEITKLKGLKDSIPKKSFFGDDNHAAVDVQIQVLEQLMSNNDVYDTWGDDEIEEFDQHTLDSALEASNWLTSDRDEPPSSGW